MFEEFMIVWLFFFFQLASSTLALEENAATPCCSQDPEMFGELQKFLEN